MHLPRSAGARRARCGGGLHIHQRAQGPAAVAMGRHVDRDLADGDGTFDADGDMVGIVRDPDGHLLTAREHGAMDQKGFEFDGAEFCILGTDSLFPQIADIEMIDLSVQEHIEGDLIPGFVLVEINITGIESSTQHILDTIRDGIHA